MGNVSYFLSDKELVAQAAVLPAVAGATYFLEGSAERPRADGNIDHLMEIGEITVSYRANDGDTLLDVITMLYDNYVDACEKAAVYPRELVYEGFVTEGDKIALCWGT